VSLLEPDPKLANEDFGGVIEPFTGEDEVTIGKDHRNENKYSKYDWRHYYEAPKAKDFKPGEGFQHKLTSAPPPRSRRFKYCTPGHIMALTIAEAQARGALKELRYDFNTNKDSNGVKWDTKPGTKISHKFKPGTTVLQIARWLDKQGYAECRMNGRTVQLFKKPVGKDYSDEIVLSLGKNLVDGPKDQTARDMATSLYIVSESGVHGWVTKASKKNKYGRIEAIHNINTVKTWREAENRGDKILDKSTEPRVQYTYGVVPDKGANPYQDYEIGDTIAVLEKGIPKAHKVRQIGLQWGENNELAIALTLSDILELKTMKLSTNMREITGRTASAARESSEIVSSGGRDDDVMIADSLAPNPPSIPIVATRNGIVNVTWDGKDETGSEPVWDQDHVQVHKVPDDSYPPDDTTLVATMSVAGTISLNDIDYDDTSIFKFVAVDQGGDLSIVEISPDRVTTEDISSEGPTLPPPLIPGIEEYPDGLEWTGFILVEKLRAGAIQTDIAVAGSIWVAKYADETDPESGPAEDSAIITMDPYEGFTVWVPKIDPTTGALVYALDDNGNMVQQREASVNFPVLSVKFNATENKWEQVAALFRGIVTATHLTVSEKLELLGRESEGHTNELGIGAALRLNASVANPTDTVQSVTFGAKQRRWPGAENFQEVGMGHNANFIIQGRLDQQANFYTISARYIDPNTGLLDHASNQNFPFDTVGGFTSSGGRHYVLGKWSKGSDPWTIAEMDGDMGGFTGVNVNVNSFLDGLGVNKVCLGNAGRDDCVALAYRDDDDDVHIRYYNLNLNNHPDLSNRDTNLNTSKRLTGVPGSGIVAAGNQFYSFIGATWNDGLSWWSYCGTMTGAGWHPDVGFMATNGAGLMFYYNDTILSDSAAEFCYTRALSVGAKETTRSALKKVIWPAKTWATITAQAIAPSTDNVQIYGVFSSADAPSLTSLIRIPKTVGEIQVQIDTIPSVGSNPPSTSTFGTAGEIPSKIYTQALIPGTSRPAAYIDASGKAEFYGLTTPGVGRRNTTGPNVPSGAPGIIIPWDLAVETHTDIPYTTLGSFFTMNLAGHYMINAGIGWTASPTTSGFRKLICFVNNVEVLTGIGPGPSTAGGTGLSGIIKVNAGDTVSFGAQQNASGATVAMRAISTENFVQLMRLGT
jgi:hypothetical protein